ncbi:MAG: Flp pilus assembly complex ATPase component TadA [Candidatus Pacebacteria bacterium]|nr:Flp pilus assembly complex ATPase component TadA [Candidatus Paceibacterota bacterium]
MEDTLIKGLVDTGVLSKEDAQTVQDNAKANNVSLEEVLQDVGVSKESILAARAGDTGVPTRVLKDTQVPFNILSHIPEESATHYSMVPLGVVEGVLEVGMTDPTNIEAIDALNFLTRKKGLPFKVFLISDVDLKEILKMYNSLGGEVGRALSELETELTVDEKNIQAAIDEQETDGGTYIKEDAPVIKIVATILRYAVDGRASDVHIERTDKMIKVRFRVDGVLHTSLTLPGNVHQAIVARVKVLSAMRLDERRKPQDGRFSATIGGHKIDFRVSTFPTSNGEKIVMRILDRERGFISLDKIGLSEGNLKKVRSAIARPHGLILVSGPTGSGKSTTLYSMLAEIDRETKNVLSLEDPVEYFIEGVSQSQVRPEIGYTFANGLRTTLRQDPDVIMVGEIRDAETAKLAIQAALTGHLVLSTIHTNSAIGVIPRLVDMGVDPYLIAPTLVLAVAQRLVRRVCPGAEDGHVMDASTRAMLEDQFGDLPEKYRPTIPEKLYEAKATAECPSGLRGRLAVFELLPMTAELERQVLEDSSEDKVRAIARRNGMLTMKEDAILKSFTGSIPFSEANKLSGALLAEKIIENPLEETTTSVDEQVSLEEDGQV